MVLRVFSNQYDSMIYVLDLLQRKTSSHVALMQQTWVAGTGKTSLSSTQNTEKLVINCLFQLRTLKVILIYVTTLSLLFCVVLLRFVFFTHRSQGTSHFVIIPIYSENREEESQANSWRQSTQKEAGLDGDPSTQAFAHKFVP